MNSRREKFKELLYSKETNFLMEAHNALSAKIVESVGFQAIWASGLSISTSLGVRDSNELSSTQVLDVLTYMAASTSIPILVDGDTGYGNFNNARIFVKNLCSIEIAGVCIEDKIFPKTNSFISKKQQLADIDEFCGKIKAIKDHQTNDDFCLISRIEALITGAGMDEALQRADAYHSAGADGILIHSKQDTASEVLTFAQHWKNRCPIIIVPTKYYKTPVSEFREANISLVIWANHGVRASITALKTIYKKIFDEQSIMNVENEICTLDDIFSIIDYKELSDAEEKYLTKGKQIL